jgi:hypothetical protein
MMLDLRDAPALDWSTDGHVIEAAASLETNEDLTVLLNHEPWHLRDLMELKGFSNRTDRDAEGHWVIVFSTQIDDGA